jgi:multiple sugar transport system permease protein
VPHSTFFRFMGPSLLAMILFIALPIVSIVVQSLYIEHPQVIVSSETCQPFGGCTTTTVWTQPPRRSCGPSSRWVGSTGLGTYLDRTTWPSPRLAEICRSAEGFATRWRASTTCRSTRRWPSPSPTCALVTPLAMILGLCIALAVNTVPRMLKGTVIFFSLVPMLITPLVGALILYWMLNSEGILGAAIQNIFNDPGLSTRTSAPLTWATLIAYGTWTNAPFSFIVFYAGLQAVPRETLEAAMIDGASRSSASASSCCPRSSR